MKFLSHNSRSQGPSITQMARKSPGIAIITLILITSLLYALSNSSFHGVGETIPDYVPKAKNQHSDAIISDNSMSNSLTNAEVDTPFMPKMGNATLRKELGNASWKLFHTILARYPDDPTDAQKLHLKTYIYTFAQVYPCGDCARHFIKLLGKYPPQVGSRKNAAVWGCDIHNQVNKRLHHPIYDCSNILEDYDCGCGVDEESSDYTLKGKTLKEVEDENKEQQETREHLDSIRVESTENHIGG